MLASAIAARSISSFWILLAFSIFFNAGGGLLLKKSRVDPWLLHLGSVHFSAWLIVALASYALNFVFFAAALTRIQLTTAYPVQIGMTFAIITILSPALFGERLGWQHLAGIATILAGVILLTRPS